MVQHIVMFKFRADVSPQEREAAARLFKKGIEELPAVIPFIGSVHVGLNVNPSEEWDICLVSEFASLEEVRAYSFHPAHKAVAGELMRHIAQRACVDFEK